MRFSSKSRFLQCPTFTSPKKCAIIHGQMVVNGTVNNRSAITNLLVPLVDPDNGDLDYALAIFHQIPNPSTFLWNTIIRAFSKNRFPQESITLYRKMCRFGVVPDVYTFQFSFSACAMYSSTSTGQAIHGSFFKHFVESDVYVMNSLMHMYSEFGWVDTVRRVFDEMSLRNVVSWTTMVGGYAKIGMMGDAMILFDEMHERNVVSWTSIISGYARAGQAQEAVQYFKKMVYANVKPDAVTMVSVLSACAQLRNLDLGKWVHRFVDKEFGMSRVLAVALIDMYAKCGDIEAARWVFDTMGQGILAAWNAIIDGYCKLGELSVARSLFDQMDESDRDLITFNSMITGYIQSSNHMEALLLFSELRALDLAPDNFMIASLLTACANQGALIQGKVLHAYIEKISNGQDPFVETAFIDMYAKCGSVDQAMQIFNEMSKKDVQAWTAMITGLAMHGYGKSALALFRSMREEGTRPNNVTYVGVLSACSHAGLIEQGLLHFDEMRSLYKIEPEVEHYGCMVDLLGRSGYIKEAEGLIHCMPIKPNSVIWSSLLSSCRVYNDVKRAEKAMKNLLDLESQNDAAYVLLYNMYASSGKWEKATDIRSIMDNRGIVKTAGFSSIEMDGNIHEFIAGDRSHPQFDEIHMVMGEITTRMKLAGNMLSTLQV